jgi:hypothetical protein
MTTEAANPVPMTTPTPRPITIEAVHQLIGALTLELDALRRENAALRAQLELRTVNAGPPAEVAR